MTKVLLSIHILVAIVAIGPVTVAASMFPAAMRRQDTAVLRNLHRICKVYAVVGAAVPFFGLATAGSMRVLGDTWLIISIVLTVIAAGVLIFLILPGQQGVLDESSDTIVLAPARLAMYTGIFNFLWAAVTVLMIVRPGSTTGA